MVFIGRQTWISCQHDVFAEEVEGLSGGAYVYDLPPSLQQLLRFVGE